MSLKLINYLQEQVDLSAISFSRSFNLLEMFKELVNIGQTSNVSAVIIEAAILVPAFSKKRVNLHVKLSLNKLSQHASPEALKLAMTYAALNNPTRELWDGTVKAEKLFDLQAIDTLYAYASELQADHHVTFAKTHNILFKGQATALARLEAEYVSALQQGYVYDPASGIKTKIGDGHMIVYLAYISHQDKASAPIEFIAFTKDLQRVSYWLMPEQAKAALMGIMARLNELHTDYNKAREEVQNGKLDRKLIDIQS